MKTLTALLILCATVANAQQARDCAPRDAAIDWLATGYGETRQAIGLGPNNQVFEVFASDETGTWTITVTLPNGMTCLVASGTAFEHLSEALPLDGDPA